PSLETKKQDETPQVKVQVENPAVASKSAAEQVVGQAQIMNPNQKDENGVGDKNTDTVAGEKTSKDAPVIKVVDQKDSSQTQQDNKNNTPNQESNNQSSKTDVKKLIDSETGKLRGLSKSEAVAETTDSSNQNTTTTVNRVDTAENTVKSTAVKQEMQAPKLDTKDIMNQIVQKAEVMVKDNKSAITIDLKPEFLGKLQISLSVQDGVVTARFTTENQNVKQLLEGGLSQLKSVFENNGIKLEKAEVNVDLGNSGSSYQGFNESQGRQDRYTELPDRWWDNRRESGDYTPLQQVQQLIDEPSVNYTGDGVNFLI
ncbi:MAG: flagellar hook-length control protein FliK, partial [Acidobacteriota bacterium]